MWTGHRWTSIARAPLGHSCIPSCPATHKHAKRKSSATPGSRCRSTAAACDHSPTQNLVQCLLGHVGKPSWFADCGSRQQALTRQQSSARDHTNMHPIKIEGSRRQSKLQETRIDSREKEIRDLTTRTRTKEKPNGRETSEAGGRDESAGIMDERRRHGQAAASDRQARTCP